MTTTLQALLACGAMITGINLIVWCASGELDLPQTLLEPLHPLLAAGFFLIAICLWVVYRNLRGLWKKRWLCRGLSLSKVRHNDTMDPGKKIGW